MLHLRESRPEFQGRPVERTEIEVSTEYASAEWIPAIVQVGWIKSVLRFKQRPILFRDTAYNELELLTTALGQKFAWRTIMRDPIKSQILLESPFFQVLKGPVCSYPPAKVREWQEGAIMRHREALTNLEGLYLIGEPIPLDFFGSS